METLANRLQLTRTLTAVLVAALLLASMPCGALAQSGTLKLPSATTTSSVPAQALVLYDAPSGQKFGMVYSIMVRNLLGHFNMKADLMPVESYTAGKVENYRAIFYLGTYYDNPLPETLLGDLAKTQKTVVWFKYNLWQLAWNTDYNFPAQRGFTFGSLRGMNVAPSAGNPKPGFFDTISYKNREMVKYYDYDVASNTIKSDPDFGIAQITDSTRATAVVSATNSVTGEIAPYVTRSGNFWYFADAPLSYIGPRDRYLAFCDLLHDILGIDHPELHRAMVRLEDVSALVDPDAMKRLTDYLYGRRIPFGIAAIPFYRDPLGLYNGGVAQEVHLKNAPDLLASLTYAQARGGSINIHGYTHQYNNIRNIHTGVSADDFEFWLATENRPVNEDSVAWATGRLRAAQDEFARQKFPFYAFEPPHYQASPKAYQAIQKLFPNAYQRAIYYTSDTPKLNTTAADRDYSAGMFYPYIISSDHYGQRIMPENLGNIEYDISYIDSTSNVTYTADDLLLNADYALVVRDGFASFFFHPFWIESSLSHLNGYGDFTRTVEGITALGYEWVGMKDLIISTTSVSPNSGTANGGALITIKGRSFEPGARVRIGDIEATEVVVVNPTTITCRTPANKRGDMRVTVINADGRSSSLDKGFTYK